MKVNIYYGGRGVLDDPTLYVIQKMESVLIELRVEVHRYNIYEQKNAISMLPQTLKDVDGIILATTVEWLGIGGYMNQLLDACWLYGDKESISSIVSFLYSPAFKSSDNTSGPIDMRFKYVTLFPTASNILFT